MQSFYSAKGNSLIRYGILMILLGLALITYDPTAKQLALYMKAKSGLIVAGVFGLWGIAAGLIAKKGKRLGVILGIAASGLFMCAAVPVLKKNWVAGLGNEPHKLYAAVVTSVMFLLSFGTLVSVARGLAFAPDAEEK